MGRKSSKKRLRRQASSNLPERLSWQWYKRQPKKDRDTLGLIVLILVFVITQMVWTIFSSSDDSMYYRHNSVLFMMCIGIFLVSIIRRQDLKNIYNNFVSLAKGKINNNINQLTDAVLFGCIIIAVVSFVLVIDLSFIGSYGFRIGAVVAVSIFSLLRSVVRSFRD
jgi:peptidoglycan/LPS O-acetylase OafA/YrhL